MKTTNQGAVKLSKTEKVLSCQFQSLWLERLTRNPNFFTVQDDFLDFSSNRKNKKSLPDEFHFEKGKHLS